MSAAIARYRREECLRRTFERRPDLIVDGEMHGDWAFYRLDGSLKLLSKRRDRVAADHIGVDLGVEHRGVVFAAEALFDFDKAVLKPEGMAAIDRDVISKLSGVTKLELVLVTGHTAFDVDFAQLVRDNAPRAVARERIEARAVEGTDASDATSVVADALAYTPSAISQQLSVLEAEAGVPLLERAGRRVVELLTEARRHEAIRRAMHHQHRHRHLGHLAY